MKNNSVVFRFAAHPVLHPTISDNYRRNKTMFTINGILTLVSLGAVLLEDNPANRGPWLISLLLNSMAFGAAIQKRIAPKT